MKITIVYDNVVLEKNLALKSDWGFSCYIEDKKENILFDVGAKGKILLNNMQELGINPKDIDKIVISHEHWDHNGGLKLLDKYLENVELYRFEKNHDFENMKIIDSEKPQNITNNIFTTGRLKGLPVDEQSLILKGDKGQYVLAGCSHSTVKKILNSAKKHGKINGIIGGFHGFSDYDILKNLDLIIPCHCTKHIKEILNIYPEKSQSGGVGKVIEI